MSCVSRWWRLADAHAKKIWPRWTYLPALPFVIWGLSWMLFGPFRWEHLGYVFGVPLFAYASLRTKKMLIGLYPLLLTGVVYDGMRYVKNVGLSPSRVHGCDIYNFEKGLFGLRLGGLPVTPNEWWQAHASVPLDLLCAIPYSLFIFVIIGYAMWLYRKSFDQMLVLAWAFFVANFVGYLTYHLFPAAPPWYIAAHGCAIDLSTSASPGANLIRVDHLLHITYFEAMYGRASDVFGAMPSLHVSYGLFLCFVGRRFQPWWLKILTTAFFFVMMFAAVYLNHHFFTDVVAGLVYGGLSAWLAHAVVMARARTAAVPSPASFAS